MDCLIDFDGLFNGFSWILLDFDGFSMDFDGLLNGFTWIV